MLSLFTNYGLKVTLPQVRSSRTYNKPSRSEPTASYACRYARSNLTYQILVAVKSHHYVCQWIPRIRL